MAAPWYRQYFTSEFWAFARHEYTEIRTTREAAYIDNALATLAPGRRVLDLGCGMGRHAIALARAGYQVTGVDVSAWALERAQVAASAAGARVTWRHMDLLRSTSWDLPAADAAICIQAFGWGEDTEQLRLLRTLHRHLNAGGLLILDHSNLTAILRSYVPRAQLEAGGESFDLLRSFDPLTGRSIGELRVRHADGRSARLRDNVRLYQPHEVRRLLRAGGFNVERVDADFSSGVQPGPDTRYVQFIARRSLSTVSRLVVRDPDPGVAGGLDLRWVPDEVEYVRPTLDRAWREITTQDARLVSEQARHYAVDDPFGGRAAERVASHFGCRVEPTMVALGAGSTSLLRDLGTLAASGSVLHSSLGHTDLSARARQLGAETFAVDPASGIRGFEQALYQHRPLLAVIDRPSIEGELAELATVKRMASRAAGTGTILVVDEACATYAGPHASAVRLASDQENLIVVRSLSKGYCCGGLRVGFAVSSPAVAADVRAVFTPLAVSELALKVTLRLLEEGDIFGPLRRRIAEVKPVVTAALQSLGLPIVAGDPRFPWITVAADESTLALLRDRQILVKRLSFSMDGAPARELLRISVPLSEERLHAFLDAFSDTAMGGA
jgi:histidinol-phosphate/aromatic aminotransferase/cobyric acid decarboxylase-like protein/SAM-dependent methyltransferase